MRAHFRLAIARPPAAREQQLAARRPGPGRIDNQLVVARSGDHAGVERHRLVETMVVTDVPGAAARGVEIRHLHVHEARRRTERRDAVGGHARVESALELIERAHGRWCPFIKETEPAAQHRAARAVQQHRGPDPRGHVESIDDAVAIDAAAELEEPPRIRLKPILHEQRHISASDRLRRLGREVEPPGEAAVDALDQHRLARARAVVPAVQQVEAGFEQVQSAQHVARSGHRFDHLIRRRAAVLRVEEIAERRFRPQHHRGGTLRDHVGQEFVHLHRRLAEDRVGPERALRHAGVIDVRVDVGRRVGRNEGAERRERRDARKQTAGGDQRMARREVRVGARERAEPFRRAQLVFRTARHVAGAVAELRRLLDEQPILDDRSAGLEPRAERADARDVEHRSAPGPERRVEVVQPRFPLVAGTPRLNDDEPR